MCKCFGKIRSITGNNYNFLLLKAIILYVILELSLVQGQNISHTEIYYNGNIKSITNHLKHGKGIRKWSHEEYDIDGNKHGAWIGWDENGLMSYETIWEFGIYRQYREWHSNGEKKLIMKYDKEGNLTLFKKWNEEGKELVEDLSLHDH